MKWHVLDAVFKRNFVAYFSNPTGYVFICVFVLLGSLAAFWPPEFFNSNLANLDQLNRYLPFILLVFVPAITMSVWAEERRQGTDELLLTIPASDWEVVFGKYLATVGIFTVALLFSCICNLVILLRWGTPDGGLFLSNYLGYWFVGAAMLAVGMVASFLTSNLTVAFILGLILNAPLAVADQASTVMGPGAAARLRSWSLAEQFSDFGRGVVSVASIAFFLGIVTVSLYIAMVLIGRRHWTGRRDGARMGLHFIGRSLGLAAAAVGVVLLFRAVGVRADLSEERISSLSPDTQKLLRTLDAPRPIDIKAYVSPTVPEDYTQTRLTLLNMLRQFQQLGGGRVNVEIIPTEPKTDAAALASQQFGIEPVTVLSRVRGTYREEEIFLGCAFTSGLEKVVVPFFDKGTPVEYELIRSICTAAEQKRKRLGVLSTDADLFGGFDMTSGQQRPRQAILNELEKQYEVVQVDASSPITEQYDVLLAVQPSSLGPEQMANFVATVKAGQPVAVFEDPLPVLMTGVPGTSQPRRSPGGPMAMFQPQGGQPKGDLNQLWQTLGIRPLSREGRPAMGQMGSDSLIVWQDYNPHPKLDLPSEFVFIDADLGRNEVIAPVVGGKAGQGSSSWSFNPGDPIASGLQEVLFPFPGALVKDDTADVLWSPLVQTNTRSGTIEVEQVVGNRGDMRQLQNLEKPGKQVMVLAVSLERKQPKAALDAAADPTTEGATATVVRPIRAVVVADIDLLDGRIFGLRNRPDEVFGLDFDNVTFALNVLDSLAGDDRFLKIRKRKPKHRTLERIEETVAVSREEADDKRQKFIGAFDEAEQGANIEMQKEVGEFEKKIKEMESQGDANPQAAMQAVQQLASRQRLAQRRLDTKIEQLKRTRDADVEAVERELSTKVRQEQDRQKWLAVLLPPIPPLVVAFFVYFRRRASEREGVAKSRLR
ncbi:MAG: ABC transporter permease [Planctomycetota bacterium]|nr:MAG: ABC transporter permease [Planctomycetota bacterium]